MRRLKQGWYRLLRFWVAHLALPITTIVVGVATAIAIDSMAPQRPDPTKPGQTQIYGWWAVALLVAVFIVVLGVVTLGMRWQSGENRAQRIQRLSNALQESVQVIAQMNNEIELGAMRLADLEKQTSVHEELAKLTSTEADAVREALKAELGRERRRSLVRDFGMVALGAALSYFLTRFR
jgi:uncharacterized membrane protein YhaH (DUF805 family)